MTLVHNSGEDMGDWLGSGGNGSVGRKVSLDTMLDHHAENTD